MSRLYCCMGKGVIIKDICAKLVDSDNYYTSLCVHVHTVDCFHAMCHSINHATTCLYMQMPHIYIFVYILADDTSRQTTAFAILVASMKCSADKDPLCYIYQQYDVSTYILIHSYIM